MFYLNYTEVLLRMCYLAFKADLKARKECHQFKKYYLCKNLCERCDAVQPKSNKDIDHPMSFKNMSPASPYVATCIDHAKYLETNAHDELSPWCCVPGFDLETCTYDVMHAIFLGIARDHVPSCLKFMQHLGYSYEPGESDELFLKRMSIEMRTTCKLRGSFVVYILRLV